MGISFRCSRAPLWTPYNESSCLPDLGSLFCIDFFQAAHHNNLTKAKGGVMSP